MSDRIDYECPRCEDWSRMGLSSRCPQHECLDHPELQTAPSAEQAKYDEAKERERMAAIKRLNRELDCIKASRDNGDSLT
jgi:hypothetical protein